MASIEEALTAVVLGESSITALIGQRFYPVGEQVDTYPYATWQGISRLGATHLTGGGDLDQDRVQVDIWGESALDVVAIGKAFRDFLEPADGATDITGAGLAFSASFQNAIGPQFDIDTRRFRLTQDYLLTYARS